MKFPVLLVPPTAKQRGSVRSLESINGHASLYVTLLEFDGAVLAKPNDHEQYSLESYLSRYLYDFTSGHPAAVRMVLEILSDGKVNGNISTISVCGLLLRAGV
jgi:hypothetical protein